MTTHSTWPPLQPGIRPAALTAARTNAPELPSMFHSTVKLVESAQRALTDPDQTATAEAVAGPLSKLMRSMAEAARINGTDLDTIPGLRETALFVLDHEHTRATRIDDPKEQALV